MVSLQPKLNLKVSQRQILTPGLMQMVSVLALNKLELRDMIASEIAENPVLEELEESVPMLDQVADPDTQATLAEREKPDPFEEIDFGSYFQEYLDPGFRSPQSFEINETPSIENYLSQPDSLSDHLCWQLGSLTLAPEVREAAEYIVGNLNDDGYLAAADEDLLEGYQALVSQQSASTAQRKTRLEAAEETLAQALTIVQGLDPLGVGARDLRECLLAQIRAARRTTWLTEQKQAEALAGEARRQAAQLDQHRGQDGEQNGEQDQTADQVPDDHRRQASDHAATRNGSSPAGEIAAIARATTVAVIGPAAGLLDGLATTAAIPEAGDGPEASTVLPTAAAHPGLSPALHPMRGQAPAAGPDRGPTHHSTPTYGHAPGHRTPREQIVDAAERIVDKHLMLLQKRDLRELAKAIGTTVDQANAAFDYIRTLDPRPGQRFHRGDARLIEPDVTFVKRDDEYVAVMDDDSVPTLRVNQGYRRLLKQPNAEKDVKDYVKERYRSALQLMRNIEQRKNTILRTCEVIVRRQVEFLEQGVEALKPMMIKEVAEEIGVHPSTVSRAVANKYAHTPQGVFELRFFFTEGVNGPEGSGTPLLLLKRKVKKLIDEENPRKPLTDELITHMLQSQGIDVTRRTVAKYREDLRIPSTHQRRVRD